MLRPLATHTSGAGSGPPYGLTAGCQSPGINKAVFPVFKARKLTPEVRYTRWFRDTFRAGNGLLESNRNQADFLLGITF